MVIAGLDTETTGFKFSEGHRIVEICVGVYQFDGGVLNHLKTITERINPERSIPAEAQRVHGIAYEDVKTAPKWADFAPKMKAILDRVEMLVIHNAEFDVPFIEAEQSKAGYPVSHPLQSFCTMRNGLWATFDGKSPSLRELCWSLGIEYDPSKAHAADYDVHVMMQCYAKAVAIGLFPNPIKEV